MLDPKDVLKQRVNISEEQGFADNAEEVLDQEFVKKYKEYMESDYVEKLKAHPYVQQWVKKYNEMDLTTKKKFIRHCLMDMITLHLNSLNQINQMQQDIFIDDHAESIEEALDARWFEIYIIQLAAMALGNTIPGPMQNIILEQNSGEDEDE